MKPRRCAVCSMPVLPEHAPLGVWTGRAMMVGRAPNRVIHGAFDCTDQPRCPACELPANHPPLAHYPGIAP